MSFIGNSTSQMLGVIFMVIIILAAIALMVAENIGGAGSWLALMGTEITNNMPLIGLIIVAGLALGVMGSRRK